MSSRNRRRWVIIGVVGFVLTLFIHILSIDGIDIFSRFPFLWSMHVAVMLYFACAVGFLFHAGYPWHLTFDILQDNLPVWVLFVDGLALAFSVVNFVLCNYLISPGGGSIINGEYVLTSHGKIMAHVTEAQYHLHRAYELRLFSGAWLLFWLLPLSYFLYWKHVPVHSTDRLMA